MINKIRLIILALTSITLFSCMAGSSTLEVESTVNKSNIQKIIKYKTTKSEILNIFGPPHAIARKGRTIYVPIKEGTRSRKVDSDTLFELFSASKKITAKHIIYYYNNTKMVSNMVMVIAAGNASVKSESNRLWILINNETNLVEDYVFRKAN